MAGRQGPVLVIGATGQQGGAAARELLDRGWEVRALVRDPGSPAAGELGSAGATLVTGDLDDVGSLRAAMDGAHGVFLVLTMLTGAKVTPDGVAAEERRGKAVADLVAESGVAHLVYSSISGAGLITGIPYYDSKVAIEEHIRSLGLPATVLRPVMFMENFTTLTRPVVDDGELVVSLAVRPEARIRLIAARDIGAFAAIAFDQPGRFVGRHLEIAGDCRTGPAIAEAFGRACGLPARFSRTPIEKLRAFDEQVARMFEWIGERTDDEPDLPSLRAIHPRLMTLETWLDETGWKP
ncbi:NmrA/HSCARG family protein [Nonomuraea basaltis]|uniref:NmrA/HSCARG family protein n=1 Tax=Nonomuraea basaltis TaxID=2495887 RepID=UPI00110C602B|nr:NmrA/HSCARG family protein [Nonomuraea basaltis]TMR88334.1 NmrA/HSCARG family protein [Nonomuraea basaltis]